jgi:polar amino acid transport system substrate-binding protein
VGGAYDVIIDAWTPSPQTPTAIVATSPYDYWGLVVVVRSSETRVQSFENLAGLRVGHYRDPAVLRSLSALGQKALRAFDDPSELFGALARGTLDAAVFDSPYAYWWLGRNPGFKVVGEPLNRLGYHVGVRRSDIDLARHVEEIAKSLPGSPEMAEIRRRWGGAGIPSTP